jgi:aminoglycoside phosphotransferase (APT) family kinase protein
VFRLPSRNLIVRIGPNADGLDAARREVAVARWLAGNGVPAIRVADGISQPISASGRVGTVWESASDREEYGSTIELARTLRQLHAFAIPAGLDLPPLDPFRAARRRIVRCIDEPADRDFLLDECDQRAQRYAELDFVLPTGVIHGDANVGNLIRDRDGRPLLADLDGFRIGPREWDLVLTAMYYERFGWHSQEEYEAFVATYGYDILKWPGYAVLRDVRELLMVAWLAQKVSMDAAAGQELQKRLRALRTGGSRRDWLPL